MWFPTGHCEEIDFEHAPYKGKEFAHAEGWWVVTRCHLRLKGRHKVYAKQLEEKEDE